MSFERPLSPATPQGLYKSRRVLTSSEELGEGLFCLGSILVILTPCSLRASGSSASILRELEDPGWKHQFFSEIHSHSPSYHDPALFKHLQAPHHLAWNLQSKPLSTVSKTLSVTNLRAPFWSSHHHLSHSAQGTAGRKAPRSTTHRTFTNQAHLSFRGHSQLPPDERGKISLIPFSLFQHGQKNSSQNDFLSHILIR